MKKVLTLIMAFVLVLSLSATAFAAAPTEVPTRSGLDANQTQEFTFNKVYVDANGKQITVGKQPVEKLHFEVTPAESYANAPELSIADITTDGNPNTVTISVAPNATKVTLGKYNYTIKETPGETAGVQYDTNEIKVQVMVYKDGADMKETITFTGVEGKKVTSIVNTYKTNNPDKPNPDPDPDPNYLYPLTVDKVVKGNMGDVNAVFEINVVLSSAKEVKAPIVVGSETVPASAWTKTGEAWTYTAKLELTGAGSLTTIYQVPEGVTYTVKEADKHTTIEDGTDYSNRPTEGYTASYNKENGNIKAGEVNDVVVTNTKGAEVDTGITLDVLPYVIILGIAVLSLVLFTVKRRVQD